MRIGLLGLSDKRHVAYSLIRVLGGVGRAIFVTSNQQYLMLSPDLLMDFEIGDVQVLVHSSDLNELEETYELHTYEYVIYDVLMDMPAAIDVGVIFDNHEHYLFELEDNNLEGIQLYTACEVKKEEMTQNEKLIKIPPASLVEPTLQLMFTKQTLTPIKNSSFVTSMTKVLTYMTGLSAGQITTRLKKGDLKK